MHHFVLAWKNIFLKMIKNTWCNVMIYGHFIDVVIFYVTQHLLKEVNIVVTWLAAFSFEVDCTITRIIENTFTCRWRVFLKMIKKTQKFPLSNWTSRKSTTIILAPVSIFSHIENDKIILFHTRLQFKVHCKCTGHPMVFSLL